METKFFIKYAPFIIVFMLLNLHVAGYLLERYYFRDDAVLVVWLLVATIDMIFAFKCGKLIQNLNLDGIKDSLTGLENRRFFYTNLASDLHKLQNKGAFVSVLMIDIDNFKDVNDTFGHNAGDLILQDVALLVKKSIRVSDYAIRWGGEEFLVVLPITEHEGAHCIAERIRSSVEQHSFITENNLLKVTISIGLITVNKFYSIDSLIRSADIALYKAKARKNTVVCSIEEIATGVGIV